jgi:hypothetical protein
MNKPICPVEEIEYARRKARQEARARNKAVAGASLRVCV